MPRGRGGRTAGDESGKSAYTGYLCRARRAAGDEPGKAIYLWGCLCCACKIAGSQR